jgi:hypothetical protein
MPGMASWVAPTLSIEDIDKRIQELKSVLFWLEQNTTALKATIQAMEVQKMTLTTLQSMNVNMADLAKAFTAKAPAAEPQAAAPPPFAPKAAPVPEPAQSEPVQSEPSSSDASSEDGANEDTEGSFAGQTLALFLPDGTVLTAPIFMLRTDAGVARSMRVDRATGRARVVEQSKRPANELEEFVRPEFDLPESGMSEDSSDARDSYPRGKPVGARESSGAARSR